MIDELMGTWVHAGWHLDGMPWHDYLQLTIYQRWRLHEAIREMIERTDADGGDVPGAGRPKEFRRMG